MNNFTIVRLFYDSRVMISYRADKYLFITKRPFLKTPCSSNLTTEKYLMRKVDELYTGPMLPCDYLNQKRFRYFSYNQI